MNGRTRTKRRSDCPLNVSLEIFGDRWTLLIVRDLMLKGRSRFGELLEGGEGIASNILTDRLGRLEAHSLVERRRDPADARRFCYRLTQRGIDLAPVLFEMILWAAQHEATAAPPEEVEEMLRNRSGYLASVRQAWTATK
ncbi:transcriptional regulator [Ciceribacter ferrooxidans]|uniref:Transcriptional regulator n=1 Tax=Ciceribacter ferrooxidans TaxID=2509717 RepID=A0A4Q2TAV7_9HYPH|nr:helix-turn-helix domain-containing protein [Ciceribacter ferrooxidans]RYC14009.1 transcriptional regulator [Ciceribacter ferrooxidans]